MDFHFWSWKSLGKVMENTFWKRVVTLTTTHYGIMALYKFRIIIIIMINGLELISRWGLTLAVLGEGSLKPHPTPTWIRHWPQNTDSRKCQSLSCVCTRPTAHKMLVMLLLKQHFERDRLAGTWAERLRRLTLTSGRHHQAKMRSSPLTERRLSSLDRITTSDPPFPWRRMASHGW